MTDLESEPYAPDPAESLRAHLAAAAAAYEQLGALPGLEHLCAVDAAAMGRWVALGRALRAARGEAECLP